MYKHILFAVGFGEKTYFAVQKVKELMGIFQAKLSLIHVVELPTTSSTADLLLNDKESCIEHAKQQLAEIGKKLNVPIENQYLEVGDPKVIIPDYMKTLHIDLLIVGHHERHGIYYALGSTANALISHAKCEVLTIPYSKY